MVNIIKDISEVLERLAEKAGNFLDHEGDEIEKNPAVERVTIVYENLIKAFTSKGKMVEISVNGDLLTIISDEPDIIVHLDQSEEELLKIYG